MFVVFSFKQVLLNVPLNADILNIASNFLIRHIPYLSLFPTNRFTLYCIMVAGIQRMFINTRVYSGD